MSLISVLFAAAVVQASAPADFSGVWMLDPARSETLRSGGQVERGPITITRRGETFDVSPLRVGAETVTTLAEDVSSLAQASQRPLAHPNGPALVTHSQMTINGKAVTVRYTRTLAPGGDEMTVQTNVAIHHGYSNGEALPESEAQDVYVRAPG